MTAQQILAERDLLWRVIQQIAATDSRYGVHMQETASDTVRQILEDRIDAEIKERATT